MASRVLRTGGLFYNGVSDCVSIPHSDSLDLKTALTLIALVYRTRAVDEWIINKNYDDFANTQYGLFIDHVHAIRFCLNGDFRVNYILNTMGTWARIGCVWNGAAAKIYVNGELKATASYSATLTSQPYALTLACRKTTGGVPGLYWFRGMIDDVFIYNRALSDAEMAKIHQGIFIKDGLVLSLPFHEGEGTIAHDTSGYGNHGTLYGNPMWVVKKALVR